MHHIDPFRLVSGRSQVAKIQYALKITFIFVALLFVDAVQRLVRVSQEAQANKEAQGPATDLRTETAVHSRKVRWPPEFLPPVERLTLGPLLIGLFSSMPSATST